MSNTSNDDRTRIDPSPSNIPPTETQAPGDFAAGDLIAGSYKVLAFIGRGGMGSVYRVHHMFLDKELALKTLSGNQITEVAWRRFQIEGQAIARLDHRNIIRIYDLGIAGENQPYYVMDLVEGITLAQLIQDKGALSPAFALPIFRQVSAGMAYAHEHGIIHRDLKPSNIMLVQQAPTSSSKDTPIDQTRAAPITAKLLDFGLAKLTDLAGGSASALTKTGEIFGSPLYMSPQQAQGLSVDHSSDIYSFGCTLFDALTGSPPLKGATAIETMLLHQSKVPPRLSQVRPDLEFSKELEQMVAKLLAKKPEARYRSFNDIAAHLLLLERPQDKARPNSYNLGKGQQIQPENQITGEFTNPPAPSITSKRWFWPSFIIGAILILCVIATITYSALVPRTQLSFDFSSLSQGSAQAKKLVPDVPSTASPEDTVATTGANDDPSTKTLMDGKFSSLEGSGRNQQKIFNIDTTYSLGTIRVAQIDQERIALAAKWRQEHGSLENNPYTDGVPAKGKQQFSVTRKLLFKPTPKACSTPLLFKRFNANDFAELDLSNNPFVDSDFLQYIRHLKGLTTLKLDDTEVDDRALKVIEGLPKLEELSISRTKISEGGLTNSSILKQINHLNYCGQQGVTKLLKTVKDWKNILELGLAENQLTTTDLKLLAGMPMLRKISASNGVGDEGLKILSASKSLRNMDITDKSLTPACIPILDSWNLEQLTISGAGWSAADKKKLHAALAQHKQHCAVTIKTDDLD